jgi:hypothetical protein
MILKKLQDTQTLYQRVFIHEKKKSTYSTDPKGPAPPCPATPIPSGSQSNSNKSYSRNQRKKQLLTPLETISHIRGDNTTKSAREGQFNSLFTCSNKVRVSYKQPVSTYSQSGKAIVQSNLVPHKIPVNLAIRPRQKNFRYKSSILASEQLENNQRLNIEIIIVGLVAAKASELFILKNTNRTNILLYKTKTSEKKACSVENLEHAKGGPVGSVENLEHGVAGHEATGSETAGSVTAGCSATGDHDEPNLSSLQDQATNKSRADEPKRASSAVVVVGPTGFVPGGCAPGSLEFANSKKVVAPTKVGLRPKQSRRKCLDSNYISSRRDGQSRPFRVGLEIEELTQISSLTTFLVNTCNFYTKQILSRKVNKYVSNFNSVLISDKQKAAFLQELQFEMETRFPFQSTKKQQFSEQKVFSNAPRAHWQDKISKEIGFSEESFADWYRIYIADPEEKSSNIEWVAPDDYYQNHPIKIFTKTNLTPSTFKDSKKEHTQFVFSQGDSSDLSSLRDQVTSKSKQEQGRQSRVISLTDPKGASLPEGRGVAGLPEGRGEVGLPEGKGEVGLPEGRGEVGSLESFESTCSVSKQKKNSIFHPRAKKRSARHYWSRESNCKPVFWNNLDQLDNNFIYHTLLLRCFNDTFCIIDENRELLDLISDYLLRFELLRQPKLIKIFNK